MSQSDVVLLERTKGLYPISVATSLALESLFNIHPDITHEVPPHGQMNRFWINLRTMYRNIMGAVPSDVVSEIDPRAVAQVMFEEMEYIQDLFQEQTHVVEVQYYFCNYRNLEKRFPLAHVRFDRTEKQKHHTRHQLMTMEHLFKRIAPYQTKDHELVRLYEEKIKSPYPAKAHTVFLTHLAIDLLEAQQFGQVHLIESHTGAYKPRSLWYTKLYDGKHLSMIPFIPVFLQIFGDTTMFSPHPDKKLKSDLIELAKKYHWTPTSTTALIRHSLESMLNPYAKEILLYLT